ncbi:hypothetical protein DW846_02105 [Ruminococcus sp. AM36-2AA]|nr:hypothetical protein DW851_02100 [Ruminococcus sp. AM36-5]RGH62417.1 hypothetical protein DW846_02105 [Ruminococcus sp. AM36-2AA]
MMELNELQNYEEMKDKLIVRLMNYENHKEILKNTYFMKIGDIAAAICITDKKTAHILDKEVLDKYINTVGSFSKVFLNACENTRQLYPPKALLNPTNIIFKNFKDPYTIKKINLAGLMITNDKAFLGASSIFFPGLLKNISKKAANGNDLLISFTSVHEAIIHEFRKDLGPEAIKEAVREVNDNLNNGTQNFLTNKIYVYYAAQDCVREYPM